MDSFGGSSDLAETGSTLFSGGLFWRELKLSRNWLQIIFRQIVLEVAQIWRELAPHYFLTDCFEGSSNLEGTSSTLFSGRLFWKFGGNWSDRLFWRQLKFWGNWLYIIFRWIVLEIWRELAPHFFLVDCFGGSSDLAGTCSTLFSKRLSWRQLRFGGNWLHIIFWRIVLEAAQIWREPQQKNWHNHITVPAQIWRELAPQYFPVDCFGGSSN